MFVFNTLIKPDLVGFCPPQRGGSVGSPSVSFLISSSQSRSRRRRNQIWTCCKYKNPFLIRRSRHMYKQVTQNCHMEKTVQWWFEKKYNDIQEHGNKYSGSYRYLVPNFIWRYWIKICRSFFTNPFFSAIRCLPTTLDLQNETFYLHEFSKHILLLCHTLLFDQITVLTLNEHQQ